jgi:uncharacterized protein
MKPSLAFEQNRDAIKAVIARYPVRNARLFGSTVKGTDREGSDLDILVDALPDTTLFHMSGIQFDLEDLLGIPVEVHTPLEISPRYRDQVLAEARPI